jgi:hypothetical protein
MAAMSDDVLDIHDARSCRSRPLRPTFAPLIRSAAMCRALAGLGIAQILLAAAHVRGAECPIYEVIGIPCRR